MSIEQSAGSGYRNTYYVLRHGISIANEEELIVSQPENGVGNYGLSANGVPHTEERLRPAYVDARFGFQFSRDTTIVFTSDFARASETAAIFVRMFDLDEARIDERLRERNFGSLELKSSKEYNRVWAFDEQRVDHSEFDAESTAKVAARLQAFLDECEKNHAGKHIVCVSHGDPSQIFQTIFAGLAPNKHRTLPHLENAELRKLN